MALIGPGDAGPWTSDREDSVFEGNFVRRFATMHWSILTPECSLHWNGETLSEGPGVARGDAPEGDPVEDVWKTYYASIFNPARARKSTIVRWPTVPEPGEA